MVWYKKSYYAIIDKNNEILKKMVRNYEENESLRKVGGEKK